MIAAKPDLGMSFSLPKAMAITLETIAQKLGVSKATVSLALRDSPRISAELRAQVAHTAAELGYTPNPLISALMVSLRGQRPPERAASLCFLTSYPTRTGWRRQSVFARYHAGALRRAESLGYGLETHWAREPDRSESGLTRMLEARGIPGILIAPLPPDAPRLPVDFSRFATVAFGYTFKQSTVHRVTNHQFHTVLTALDACLARGHRRIGLAVTQGSDARVNHLWLAGFLTFQATHIGVPKIAPLIAHTLDQATFMAWFEKHRPEVVVSTEFNALEHLANSGLRVPADVAFVHLDWSPEHGDIAAVDQRPEQTGEAAIDLLVEQINHNRRGLPSVPRTVLIEGVWRDGPTLPARKTTCGRRPRRPKDNA